MTSLETMELAFVGNYSQAAIKPRMDQAMRLYKLPLTEENYSRAGSALVSLRKTSGYPEMEILKHMICSHVPGVNITFGSAVGMSVFSLQIGDKCYN